MSEQEGYIIDDKEICKIRTHKFGEGLILSPYIQIDAQEVDDDNYRYYTELKEWAIKVEFEWYFLSEKLVPSVVAEYVYEIIERQNGGVE